ncbi:response regulator transcription factor [Desertivirga brevis]|uniref:response regulator transcription factor n=1 Tax=Desertivirga brevis TaxID=2810310 RepID=UPI001A95C053|nr:response regulator transcription factor [Pedobacter sp. SYSU D00873]
MIEIILVEDHKIVRNGLKTMLEQEEDFTITGEASNGAEALSLLHAGTKADIILTDVNMPDMDGITLAGILKRDYQDLKVLILSMMDNEKYVFQAFEAGISGYLLKSTGLEEMIFSIRHVINGNQVICADLGMRMLKKASRAAILNEDAEAAHLLTARELEVLALISEGYTNNEIAEKTFTSRRTVEGHRQSLIDKFGVKNTAQLIKHACKTGIL